MPRLNLLRNMTMLGVFACTTYLTGCAQSPQVYDDVSKQAEPVQWLPAPLATQLNEASVGSEFFATQSPWGPSAKVSVLSRYFAASGLTCLKLQVNNLSNPSTVCRNQQQQWLLNPEILLTVTQ